jgi:2-oxoglutarate dehydrogenase E2 component (dihydrolipoamide succinyltransferase)
MAAEGSIASILKQEGDAVEEDEVIFQIDTDKVTIDVRAPEAGRLDKILVRRLTDDSSRVLVQAD